MKTEENLLNYCKKRVNNIHKILGISANEFSDEDYHQLRVEIKKLHAIMEFTNYCCPNFKKKKYFKPFKRFFIQSGKIRELQLEESLLEKYNTAKIENILLKVKEDIKKEQKSFCMLIQKKQKKKIKKAYKKIALNLKSIPDSKVYDFIEEGKRNINSLIVKNPLDPGSLHELRKSRKQNYYSRESMHLRDKNKWEEEDNFQELLGNWHDSKTISNLIEKSIIKKKTNTDELNLLLQIDEEINANRRLLFDKINNTVETKRLFT